VHPDDETAFTKHNANGKTEMWYIVKAENNAELISGFKPYTEKSTYISALNSGKLESLLNFEKVYPGDVFFMPPGRVHAIGAGIVLVEIQQTSDMTYRIYDWGRTDNQGNPRELHTELALDVINFGAAKNAKTKYSVIKNKTINLIECQYFKTNLLEFNQAIEKDYNLIDSFVIYICVEGSFKIKYGTGKTEIVRNGESILIPAILKNLVLYPTGDTKIIEVYIPEN
jgi:mannose-6-phosphate isomerase